jgi:hypothetical protein
MLGPLVSLRCRLNGARSLASHTCASCSAMRRWPERRCGCRPRTSPRAPYPLTVGPKEKPFPSLPATAVELSPTPLYLSPHLCSFIATPLLLLHRHSSRPTSYHPVSPASLPSRCSQPRGKSTTGVPARALHHPPSSATTNSSSTGHLRLSPTPSPPPRAPPHLRVLHRPLHRR